ncbi:MAG: KpsF/GutQ family sugar-phosphate isomerase [Planctomycetota bacterium]
MARRKNILALARKVLDVEARTLTTLKKRLGRGFEAAVRVIRACRGRVIVTGMGKAGLVARKISATFASTGTPSLFLHPAEAIHGDLGRVAREDVVLALSNSGETEELIRLLPHVREIGARIVTVTGDPDSPLARASDVVIDIGEIDEACPLGLAPTASTTALLALGDALCLVVADLEGFTADEYARFHPGGSLGRKLMKVRDVMRGLDRTPVVPSRMPVGKVLLRITGARAGAACVTDRRGRLLGIFTDGDLRRHMDHGRDIGKRPIAEVMTPRPTTISSDALAVDALAVIRARQVDELPVVDAKGRLLGVVDVQDLLGRGIV